MAYSVDRIIDNTAVCIDDYGEIFNISADLIDGEFKEGSVLKEKNGRFYADSDEEHSRKEENFLLAESLFEN